MRLNLDTDPPVGGSIAEGDPLPPHDRAARTAAAPLELLYRTHRYKLLRFIRRRSGSDQASDVVQQLFARLAAQPGGDAPPVHSPGAYLRQGARNLIRDAARADERRSAPLHLCLDDVPLAAPDPIAALEARDMLNRLEAVLLRLPARTREIFLAHRLDGWSYAEIAARTGLSVKTVEKHMSRAISYLGRHAERW